MRRLLALVTAVLAGCGASPKEAEPKLGSSPRRPAPIPVGDRAWMLGRMCPELAGGGPAVIGVAMGERDWTTDRLVLQETIARRGTRQFSVLSWHGGRAGLFSVAGAATSEALASGRPLAIGAYAGSLPCADRDGQLSRDCLAVTGNCGVAVARVEPSAGLGARPFGEDPDPVPVVSATVCWKGSEFGVDLDGDGEREVFDAAALSGRDLPAELLVVRRDRRDCESGPAPPGGVSLLAASDLDHDGRVDLLLSRRSRTTERWALYRASQTSMRLERAFVVDVGAVIQSPRGK